MTIDDQMYDIGADVYYSKAFRDVLESHMVYFRNQARQKTLEVDPQKAEVYAGDLFGFLSYSKVAPRNHWLVMRVNNFYAPTEFGPGVTSLIINDPSEIESLRQSFNAGATGSITL